MTFELARALLNAEVVTPVPLARALFTVATEGVPLTRALIALHVVKEDRLEEELARVDVPTINQVVPVPELLDLLPAGLCSRLLALPIRRDPRTGTVDVAVVDARDPHAANEIGFFCRLPCVSCERRCKCSKPRSITRRADQQARRSARAADGHEGKRESKPPKKHDSKFNRRAIRRRAIRRSKFRFRS